MNKSKCPICHSEHTKKNGCRSGIQTYKCVSCGYQFRNSKLPSDYAIWQMYLENKQTVSELSKTFGVSKSTIKRRLQSIDLEWQQPPLSGSGFVHLDTTYWGHSWGVLLALDDATGRPLYLAFVRNETVNDYILAVSSIEARGYVIRGLVIDGKKSLFDAFRNYEIQMCQFHMMQIIRRYVTLNPRLKAARELNGLMKTLPRSYKTDFERVYNEWKVKWRSTLSKRSLLKSGKTQYTHKRLRSAMRSIDFYLPYLFTYQSLPCEGMPNTNNKIEGTFTDLKKNLNNHSGMSIENRKRFISGFFLALFRL